MWTSYTPNESQHLLSTIWTIPYYDSRMILIADGQSVTCFAQVNVQFTPSLVSLLSAAAIFSRTSTQTTHNVPESGGHRRHDQLGLLLELRCHHIVDSLDHIALQQGYATVLPLRGSDYHRDKSKVSLRELRCTLTIRLPAGNETVYDDHFVLYFDTSG